MERKPHLENISEERYYEIWHEILPTLVPELKDGSIDDVKDYLTSMYN